jgi:hypothetical protein
MTDRKFYVYEHWRPDTGEIFYVGKGHARRAFDMRRGRNRWHKFIVAKIKEMGLSVQIRVVHSDLEESEAFSREIELIAHWRKKDATLVNQTIGGDGTSGLKHTEEWKEAMRRLNLWKNMSPEAIAKTAAFHKGKKWSLGLKRPREEVERLAALNRGKRRSPDVIERLRAIRLANPTFKGKTHTAEWREKMRALQVGVPKSEETKARMRKPKSNAHKQKLSALMVGVKRSPETRAKIAENSRLMWARKNLEKLQGNQ